jgi:hypothetical protein
MTTKDSTILLNVSSGVSIPIDDPRVPTYAIKQMKKALNKHDSYDSNHYL